MLGKTHGGPLVKLYDYDGNGDRLKLTTKPELEKSLIKENNGRFGQTKDTPFMTPPLLDDFGYLADTPAAKEVQLGTYNIPPSVNKYTKKFIEMLHLPPGFEPPPDLAIIKCPKEHRQAWSKQKERTSSEPAGLHFGHYKASIQDKELCAFDAAMRSISHCFGFSPTPWQRITDFQILKKAGVWDVAKT
jgi:hypothetical protein